MVAPWLRGWRRTVSVGAAILALTSPSWSQSVRGQTLAPPKEADDSAESPEAGPVGGSTEDENSTGSAETATDARTNQIAPDAPRVAPAGPPAAPRAAEPKAPQTGSTTAVPRMGSSGLPSTAPAAPVVTRCGGPKSMPRKAPNDIDDIDLRKAAVAKGASIANWPITSTLGTIAIGGQQICTPHSKSGHWPKLDFFGDPNTKVEGNMWIFAYLDGRWVGGAGHWLRPGQTCKGGNLSQVGPDVYYDSEPLRSWSPCHGEWVGFAVSTPARAGQWGGAERSNVVIVRWP